jgi:hypothetical protein
MAAEVGLVVLLQRHRVAAAALASLALVETLLGEPLEQRALTAG